MQFKSPLIEATLLKRYKRFLADVHLSDGTLVTAHCPNTGSMTGCAEPGSRVWLSKSDNPKRKLGYTWELVEVSKGVACIHSALANKLVNEAIEQERIPELAGYDQIKPEARYGKEASRIDFLLTDHGRPPCYVEVKSVTLHAGSGQGLFPDAVSARGTKHLRELAAVVEEGHRAVLLFCVQSTAINRVAPADEIDSLYGQTLRQAMAVGVEVLSYATDINSEGVMLTERIPFSV